MKKIRCLKIILLLVAFIFLSSCASIFTGSKKKVLFESNPVGAIVYVNGEVKGITPIELKVRADDQVNFKLENYKESVVVMDSKFNLVAILNGLSIIGWSLDAMTGSLKRVNAKYVKVDLASKKAISVYEYLKKGVIKTVKINTDKNLIETIIVLND